MNVVYLRYYSCLEPSLPLAWKRLSSALLTLALALMVCGSFLSAQAQTAATPVFSLAPGEYPNAQTLTISDSTPGATIYYTTNGSYPGTNSPVYTGAITVSTSEIVTAVAGAPGYSPSAEATGQYFISSSQSRFIYTIAGSQTLGYTGDGGPATFAEVNGLQGVAVDSAGNVYMADSQHNVVRKVATGTGIITTIAGTGVAGHTGDNGPAASAEIPGPAALAVDGAGNLFIGETEENLVRRVDAGTGNITTFAGNPAGKGSLGGAATNFSLSLISGLACDRLGNLFIAEGGDIVEVNAQTGNIQEIAGFATGNYFYGGVYFLPQGIAVDGAGNIYVSNDQYTSGVVWKISPMGAVSIFAGNTNGATGGDAGPATSAGLSQPGGLAVDGAGNVYIAEGFPDTVIREVNTSGIINTVAGIFNYLEFFGGDGSPAIDVGLYYPSVIAADAAGNVYMVDQSYNRIRKITAPNLPPTLAAAAPVFSLAAGTYSGTQTLTMTDATPGAEIYVTLDGSVPTTTNQGYHGTINITGSVTVRAIALAPGFLSSAPVSATYTITTPPTAVISTIAGNGKYGFLGAGGPATTATIGYPGSVAFDASGNLYIGDSFNYVVWMVSAATGNISVVAGTGKSGNGADGGLATATQLESVSGLAVDKLGNLYISDQYAGRIREVSAQTGVITTIAGPGVVGTLGDGGLATSAYLGAPLGIAFDKTGNLYIADVGEPIADASSPGGFFYTGLVRRIDANTGIITTVAGGGTQGQLGEGGLATAADLAQPEDVTLDPAGNLYITDATFNRIRKVSGSTGIITTIAGNGTAGNSGDGGAAIAAEISVGVGIAVDGSGSVYFSNSQGTVRRVDPTTGIIATIAGDTYFGYGGDGGAASMAELDYPQGLAFDASGNLYIADSGFSVVRKVTFTSSAAAPTLSLTAGAYPGWQTVTITDATPGATIYYTADGTTPTTASTEYTGAVIVSSSETINAIAAASGYSNSTVASATYTINLPAAATPTFSPAAGTYTSTQSVTISDSTTGATIYYATNGTTPTSSSSVYTSPIIVSSTETLEAIALASGYTNSAAASVTYTINLPVAATPTFSPAAGAYNSAQTVTIADSTSGATIYYTTNGNTPTSSSSVYSGPIKVSSTESLEAIAAASGYSSSSVASALYTIPFTPTVELSPYSYTVTAAQAFPVFVSVNGNYSPPTGSVVLTSGSYSSAAATLSGGNATINIPAGVLAIPAGVLAVGYDTLTVSYTPDAASSSAYNSAFGTTSITVSPAQAIYTAVKLGTLGGASSYPCGINNSGQVVGGAQVSAGVSHAFLYNGTMIDLGTLPGDTLSVAAGINDTGQVVGSSSTVQPDCGVAPEPSPPVTSAFLYTNGVMTGPLSAVPGISGSYAYGINDSGQIVGYENNDSTPGTSPDFPFLDNAGSVVDLGALPGATAGSPGSFAFSWATRINNSGQVAGISLGVNYEHAFLFSGGSLIDLGTLPGGASSEAFGINNNGQVVGFAYFSGTNCCHAFIYSGGPLIDLGTLPGDTASVAEDINDAGQVVGSGNTHAFIYSGGAMVDLNYFVSLPAGVYLTSAAGINNRGQIAAEGIDNNTYLLTPALLIPNVAVSPASSNITTAQPLSVTVVVIGGTGNPTPTGSVTLTSGTYTSAPAKLSVGSATINIPVGALAIGTETLTVSYTPDAASSSAYYSTSGATSVLVSVGTPPALTPLFYPAAGTYSSAQTVTISESTVGAIIYYTTNGATPTSGSAIYSGPITVSSSETIEAIAAASGYTNSAVATAAYTITSGFALGASPASVSVSQGSSATINLTVTDVGAFSGNVALSASGLPSSIIASIAPSSPTGTQGLILSAASSATVTSSPVTVTITGTSGAFSASTTVALTINAQTESIFDNIVNSCGFNTQAQPTCNGFYPVFGPTGDFADPSSDFAAAQFTPSAVGMATDARIVVDQTALGPGLGASGLLNLAIFSDANGLPGTRISQTTAVLAPYCCNSAILTAWFSQPVSLNAGVPYWLVVMPGASDTYVAWFNGGVSPVPTAQTLGGEASQACDNWCAYAKTSLQFAIDSGTAPPTGFMLAASPATLNIPQSGSTTSTITVTDEGGFSGAVALAPSGLPSGVTASFAPGSSAGTQVLTLSASSSAAVTTSPATVTIAGTSRSLSTIAAVAVTVTAASGPTATTPTFSPAAGTYTSAQTVTISDATAGAVIYYTTNGTTPTASSSIYSGAITVSATETLEAIATASGDSNSNVATAAYTINQPQAATPTFSVAAGTYSSTQSVTISDATTGATIYFTTNGTTPTSSSAVYSGPITVSSSEMIEAIAAASGYTNSAVAASTYTINIPIATGPTFSPAAGTYTSAQSVTISDSTTGATIYYTTNGTTPTSNSAIYNGPITVTSSETIEAIAAASGYTNSAVANAAYTINISSNLVPVLNSLSPGYTSSGGSAFTLTGNGSGFVSGSQVYWGSSALTTTYVSSTQLTAQVPAADIASSGIAAITVQTLSPGGGTSNALQFEVDSGSLGSAPTFTTLTASVTAGSTATYPVTLPASATDVSVACLNLPAGASCNYSSASGTVTISTSSSTPAGTYQITMVFTETLPGSATALILMPILLLPLARARRRWKLGGMGLLACLGLALVVTTGLNSCGGGGGSTGGGGNPPPQTHTATNSGTVTLTVQ